MQKYLAGILLPVLCFLSPLVANAQVETTIQPSQITIGGNRIEKQPPRQIFVQTNSPIQDLRVLALDLTRRDGVTIFPASGIISNKSNWQTIRSNQIIVPVGFDLSQAPSSGEYLGNLRLTYTGGELTIPITLQIKDWWLPPLLVLFLGTGLGILVSYILITPPIEKCGLLNKVFTLDALHCSKETTQAIIESKNDYLITVKGNQIKLHNRIKILAEMEKPLTVYEEKDVSHGRNISRKVSVFDSQNVNHKNYPHLQSFIQVERTGFRGDQEYNETLYYISSQKLSAKTFAEKIKAHWLIENQVHWVKDVNFNEDKSRIKGIDVAGKFSLLVTLILNIYRSLGFSSIKEGQSWLGNNWEKILAIA